MYKARRIIKEVDWDGMKVVVFEDIYGRIRVCPKDWVDVIDHGRNC